MKKLLFLCLLLCVAGLTIYAGSPYYRVYQLKKAYDNQDSAAITMSINYQSLSTDIEQQLTQGLQQTLNQYPILQQLGGPAITQMGNQFIHSSVQRAITADSLSILVNSKGQQLDATTKELIAVWVISHNKIDLNGLIQGMIIHRGDIQAIMKGEIDKIISQGLYNQTVANQSNLQEENENIDINTTQPKPKLQYCGLNCFSIVAQVKGYPITVRMQREGYINWKIVSIKLP